MKLLSIVGSILESRFKTESKLELKIIELVNEIDKLEMQKASKLRDADCYKEIVNSYNSCMIQVRELQNKIDAKTRMIDTLKSV